MTLTWPDPIVPPAGNEARFGGRWRLVGAGLSNVWRYGDLELPAPSGRLLLRGPNGTGKTTALEVLWPFLLDLNPALLGAGRSRNTHLSLLMKDGADGRRRVGYLWMSFAAPGAGQEVVSYGVRLSFSEGANHPVTNTPFTVPGRPLHELRLWGTTREASSVEQFTETVVAAGGMIFRSDDDYIRDLASRVFGTEPDELINLAARIRQVRNPALLAVVSPQGAADALRESLPGVSEDVIDATGEALAESQATRKAFEQDQEAAVALKEFARVWTGHVVEVATTATGRAADALAAVRKHARDHARLVTEHGIAVAAEGAARADEARLGVEQEEARGRLQAIERSDEYRAAGRLRDLAASVEHQAENAQTRWDALVHAATQAASTVGDDLRQVSDLADDVATLLSGISSLEPSVAGTVALSWVEQPRTPLVVGDRSTHPGPALRVSFDEAALNAAVAAVADRADMITQEAANAKLFATDHESVVGAEGAATAARLESGRLAETADEKATLNKQRSATARSEAGDLGFQISEWLRHENVDPGWGGTDVDEIDWADPSPALHAGEAFAEMTAAWAHERAAMARARADEFERAAEALRADAADRREEAARIRDNDVLLPLPRPEWAGLGDDTVAFAAAVEWVDGVDPDAQDRVEATLVASGLLGATLSEGGVATTAWTVDATGPIVDPNLGQVLQAAAEHPFSDLAAAVLARIALAPSASSDPAPFVVGLDGTFRTGVLAALVPDATDDARRRPAQHVGGRRRREAALARADVLAAEAGELDERATALAGEAAAQRDSAVTTIAALDRYPKRDRLRDAESARVAASDASALAEAAAEVAEQRAVELGAAAITERDRWTTAVTAASLPADIDLLRQIVASAKTSVDRLRDVLRSLDGKLRRRLVAFSTAAADHDMASDLTRLHAGAVTAHAEAAAVRAELDELRAQVERTATESVKRHGEVKARLTALVTEVRAAGQTVLATAVAAAGLVVSVREAAAKLAEAEPIAAQRVIELRTLLDLSGVAAALLDAEPHPDDRRLLEQVGAAVDGKPTSARRSVRNLADETRAALAGVWAIDAGPDHPELETYLLAHGNDALGPLAAAGHAATLAQRAEEALRAADDAALQDFVIGRLPAAISQAWTRLFDWSDEVNAKMRSAAASSGVGVAVRITVRDDLAPAARTVYERACKTRDALRDPVAKAEAGRAIHQLINAADGDDMATRVRDAVNVRDWVDVVYWVTRPGEQPTIWGSRTGLSGGERRLVVLAPMLAAVAAAFDRFPAGSGRLAALDEVPSEVDEEGREGLARYIAELDLDLVATSHHWDGAPGAWDGIDAHDLEAGPDGTVVAFPILIRGTEPLPGESWDGHGLPTV